LTCYQRQLKEHSIPILPTEPGVVYQAYGGRLTTLILLVDPLGQGVSAICYAVMALMGAGPNDSLVTTAQCSYSDSVQKLAKFARPQFTKAT